MRQDICCKRKGNHVNLTWLRNTNDIWKLEIESIKSNIHRFDSLESTNRYCEVLDLQKVEDFSCFWALEQTAGIGQRGNHWASAAGQNLTFSLVLHPSFLPAVKQFKLTEALSLAIVDFLSDFNLGHPIKIKWPNDIYVGNCKICGTLVSTRLVGNTIASAICGIGLNINQTQFPDWVPNPTSLALLTCGHYELEAMLSSLLQTCSRRYEALHCGEDPELEYLQLLLNIREPARYIYQGKQITATIIGVDCHGRLLLQADDGRHLSCAMKEITYCFQ